MEQYCRACRPATVALTAFLIALSAAAGADEYEWLVYPCLKATAPPTIDGDLSDPAWTKAIAASGFTYSGRSTMPPYQMVMRLLWDEDWLYMAVEIDEPAMNKTVTTAYGRDAYVFNDDSIEWFVDPWHTHTDYYQFGINLACAMWDSHISEKAWDCDWRAAVAKTDAAWYVEAAMPLAQFTKRMVRPGAVWGFNLCHERQAGGSRELINWSNVMGNFHTPDLFGHLLFLKDLSELTPPRMARVANEVGKPAVFIAAAGWWRVDGGTRFVSYAEDLHQALNVRLRSMLRETRRSIDCDKQPELWARYRELRERWTRAQRLAKKKVDAGQWARSRPSVEALERELPELLWRAKLAALLESL